MRRTVVKRTVVLFARQPDAAAAPPGIDAGAFARAVVEDTYEALLGLAGVEVRLTIPGPPAWAGVVADLLWPGTPVLEPAGPVELLGQMAGHAAEGDAVVLVAADVPDLPGLVVAGVFSALDTVPVAAAPALRGGLVALGCRAPVRDWVLRAGVGLDTVDAPERLREAAPPGELEVTRPWRRLRQPTDVSSLDPGLEGWEATRSLLGGGSASG